MVGGRQGPAARWRIRDFDAGAVGTCRSERMREPTFEHRRLAHAFLALADDPAAPPRRSPARVVCAVAAAIVLALAAPLAWDQSTATATNKSPVAEEADDDGGDE
jgi:hypothetical protein